MLNTFVSYYLDTPALYRHCHFLLHYLERHALLDWTGRKDKGRRWTWRFIGMDAGARVPLIYISHFLHT
jgi:hypothetical protein